jgi:hypothetical protein
MHAFANSTSQCSAIVGSSPSIIHPFHFQSPRVKSSSHVWSATPTLPASYTHNPDRNPRQLTPHLNLFPSPHTRAAYTADQDEATSSSTHTSHRRSPTSATKAQSPPHASRPARPFSAPEPQTPLPAPDDHWGNVHLGILALC